nr:MAG TPA: hypothetical protein [Caudoviricetes sp.]
MSLTIKEAFEKLEGLDFEITDCTLKVFNNDLTVKNEYEGTKLEDLFAQFENKSFEYIYLYENWTDFTEFRFSTLDNYNYIDLIQKKNCEKKVKRINVKNLSQFINTLTNLEEEFKKNFESIK